MLRVSEIFFSIQGESTLVGLPTVFIRLTGCPLRCQYCDTAYAFNGGTKKTTEEIFRQVLSYETKYVTVTGGEPLAQKECFNLLSRLCDEGYCVSLETSGAMDISNVDIRVVKVMDLKTPDSGESQKNLFSNVQYLNADDQIKFVICSREDYLWAKQIISNHKLTSRCHLLFSPSYHQLKANVLADWICQDKLPVRMQIQLHKYIWGDIAGV